MDEICSTGQVSLSAMQVTTDLVTPASPNSSIKPPANQTSQARGKKRPASPANNNVGAAAAFFKKKKLTFTTASTELQQHSGIGGAAAGKKNRTWKNLKQILTAERALPWQLNDPNCKPLG
ncbi:UNVERIFIED_CONTAM: hypothetical protein FKN15_074835 [Acipenser sinensis]